MNQLSANSVSYYFASHAIPDCMIRVEELRYLFLLLTRHFKPGVQSKQYLQDLITTNHVFLLLLEKISAHPEHERQFKMYDFIKEFASPLIMQQYGHLLEDFRKNGEFVNDCVFTMMHHIAGDLSRPEVLYQPLILKTFSNIWEVEFEIKDVSFEYFKEVSVFLNLFPFRVHA